MTWIRPQALVADRVWFDAVVTAHILRNAGYDVKVVHDGREAFDRLLDPTPLAVGVLGTDLPRMPGAEIVHRTKMAGLDLPILLVSPALESNEVQPPLPGYIYTSKPVAATTLIARVREVRRVERRAPSKATRIRLGNSVIDFDLGTAVLADKPVHLTPTESRLLQYLAHQRGRVVSLTDLKTHVLKGEASLARYIYELRWKIGDDSMSSHLLPAGQTGYRLTDFEVLA